MKKIALSWIVCVLGLVILFAWMGNHVLPKPNATEAGNALINSDFTLQGAGGKLVRDEDFRGKYMLVYFGFTHCPDVCPTTLLLMSNALSQLDASAAKKVQPIFITLDPERDGWKETTTYASHFSKNLIGLSGTPEQVRHVADGFKVFYTKVEQKNSALGYVIDHSSFIYLIGPDGKYIDHYAGTASEQELAEGLAHEVH